jgi:DHA1 family multidrug resistance protein-like MFS transporter
LAGNLLGPLIGGILPRYIGIRSTFFAAGALIAIAMIATIVLIKETRKESLSTQDGVLRPESVVSGKLDTFVLTTILITAMMVLFANMSIEPIITLYLRSLGENHGNEVLHAGFVMAAAALGSILTAPSLGKIADRIGPWKVIERCLLITAVLLIPQALVTNWWQLLVLRLLMGMSLVGLLPSIAKLIRANAHDKALGRTLGLSQSAQYAGQVIGPIVGGLIGAHFGMRAVFPVTSGVLILALFLNRTASKRAT